LLIVETAILSHAFAAPTQNDLLQEVRDETPIEEAKLEDRIDIFLSVCSDSEDADLAPTPEYSCILEAQILAPQLEELDQEQQQERQEKVSGACGERPRILSVPLIANLKENLTEELQCRQEDTEFYEESCSEEFGCNMIRSGMSASNVFPDLIGAPLRSFLESRAEKTTDAKHCLDTSRSNCLTEVWTAFIANIQDTMSSLWEPL
jgi:hypothetical protein